MTKLQTGGPDGDLGSNEILISKDKVRVTHYWTALSPNHSFRQSVLLMEAVLCAIQMVLIELNWYVWQRYWLAVFQAIRKQRVLIVKSFFRLEKWLITLMQQNYLEMDLRCKSKQLCKYALTHTYSQVLISQSDITLPDGTVVPSGLAFRNEFHLTPYSSADLFVPCGGRPEAVNLKNVHRLFRDTFVSWVTYLHFFLKTLPCWWIAAV